MEPDRSRSTRRKLIAAIDPGRHASGFVLIGLDPSLHIVKTRRTRNEKLLDQLWKLPLEEVLIEGFKLYPWRITSLVWNTLLEVRLIGAVEEVCRRRNLTLRIAFPAEVKKTVSDHDLREFGCWHTNPHVRDAFRVFWYFQSFGKGDLP